MLKAKDIMTRELITVSPGTEITHAAKLLIEKGINGVPVVDEGKLLGILCQSDLIVQQKKILIPSVFTLKLFMQLSAKERISFILIRPFLEIGSLT